MIEYGKIICSILDVLVFAPSLILIICMIKYAKHC
jgi:hypothetical protein